MKKLFYIILIVMVLSFLFIINLFFKINSDVNHVLGINAIILMNFIISLSCIISIKIIFHKTMLHKSKNYRSDLKIAVSNSFLVSSTISILMSLVIYGFISNILLAFKVPNGLANYIEFASKIWFISSPFIGLEIAIFQYFLEIDFFKTPIKILILKLCTYIICGLLFYIKYKTNCFIYAKPICDLIFLPYYTKICFDITLKENFEKYSR